MADYDILFENEVSDDNDDVIDTSLLDRLFDDYGDIDSRKD